MSLHPSDRFCAIGKAILVYNHEALVRSGCDCRRCCSPSVDILDREEKKGLLLLIQGKKKKKEEEEEEKKEEEEEEASFRSKKELMNYKRFLTLRPLFSEENVSQFYRPCHDQVQNGTFLHSFLCSVLKLAASLAIYYLVWLYHRAMSGLCQILSVGRLAGCFPCPPLCG